MVVMVAWVASSLYLTLVARHLDLVKETRASKRGRRWRNCDKEMR